MATIIRLKRSTTALAPSSLATGEISYSYGAGLQSNGGDRLYFGKGDDGTGVATSVVAIGGEYFTAMLDHAHGTLTASSAIITDANSKIDQLLVDDIKLDGSTISTSNDTDLVLDATGTGQVKVNNNKIQDVANPTLPQDAATKAYVDEVAGGQFITVNGDTGTDTVNLDDSDLTFEGGQSIVTTVTDNNVKIDAVIADSDVLGVAKFDGNNFTTSNGNVAANPFLIGSTQLNLGDSVDAILGLDSLSVGNFVFSGNTLTNDGFVSELVLDTVTKIVSPSSLALGDSATNVFSVVGDSGDALFEVRQTGDVVIAGVLTVNGEGTSTFAGDVDIGGALTVQQGATVNAELVGTTLTLTGDLNVNGNTRLGDSSSNDTVQFASTITSDFIPNASSTYKLGGSVDSAWSHVYTDRVIAGGIDVDSAQIGAISIVGNVISNTNDGTIMYIDPAPVDSDGGELYIRGNLTVQGTTTTINSTEISINDKNIVLADSAVNATEADGAGLTINGPTVPATILYNGVTDRWELNKGLNLADSIGGDSLLFAGTTVTEAIEDHLVNNVLLAGDGIDLTYDDTNNNLTIAGEQATLTNRGIASFGGYADDGNTVRQFEVTNGDVKVVELDGGTY